MTAATALGAGALPEGARCAVHPESDARFACDRCGTFGCADCRFGGLPPEGVHRLAICRECAREGLSEPIPWERRKELGMIRAFAQTTRLVCLSPERFFRTPPIEKGAASGLFYGVAAYTIGQLLTFLVIIVLALLGGGVIAVAAEDAAIAGFFGAYGCILAGMTPIVIAQAPVQALFGIVIAGGAAHGTLMLMKRQKGKLEDSLRVIGYAYAPWAFVWIVPGCGVYAMYVWMLWCEFKAVRETHRAGTDGAVVAVLGFRVLFFLGILGLYAMIFLLAFLFAPGPRPGELPAPVP